MKQQIVNIPKEYKRLFDDDWREAAVFGGRYCFTGETLVSMADGTFNRIDSLAVGDKVLSMVGVDDIITSVDMFKDNYDPKPMLQVIINGYKTNTTYDHKYFNGQSYVPIYQLVWGIMGASQRRTLELLCKQYGPSTYNELQGWLQNRSDETSGQPQRLFNNGSWQEDSTNTPPNSKNIYTQPREQRDGKPQERNQDGQPLRESRVGNTQRAVDTPVANRLEDGRTLNGKQLQEDGRDSSQRIITVSLKQSNNADKANGEAFIRQDWNEIRWDKGFTGAQDMEALTDGIPVQTDDSMGSSKKWVEVARVYESTDVWCISTDKNHNYFANGVNVSNSLKSHTVARVLLIQGRQKKMRFGCFREYQNSISESSWQLLKDLIGLYELHDYKVTENSIVNTINGTDFLFKGLKHNEQSIKSIEGIDVAWVEEAQTISKESIEVLTPTVRKDGSRIIYTYNRLLDNDPVHQRLVIEGRPNTLIINANYDIAEKYGFLPDVIKNEIEDDKLNRPSLYKHKWLGEPNSLERRVYSGWQQVDDVPHEARLERRGLDFGFKNDPSALIAIYYYNGGYVLDQEMYRKGMHNNEIAIVIENQDAPGTLVVGDSAEPKSIAELKLLGVNIIGVRKVGGITSTGSKQSFKNYMIDYVGQQKISVTRRSVELWAEYTSYLHKEDRDGRILNEPEDGNDHAMDAGGYGFMGLRPVDEEDEEITAPDWIKQSMGIN